MGDKLDKKVLNQLEQLIEKVQSGNFVNEAKKVRNWGGADVGIAPRMTPSIQRWLEDQPTIISLQTTTPKKRVVITGYSKELSWLFYQLKDIAQGKIDYISKYDYYGLLAQAAIDYLDSNGDSINCKDLLITVIKQAEEFLK